MVTNSSASASVLKRGSFFFIVIDLPPVHVRVYSHLSTQGFARNARRSLGGSLPQQCISLK